MSKEVYIYRGKKEINGEWYYGNKIEIIRNWYYLVENDTNGELIKRKILFKTLGQYTGVNDKHNTPIYKGDILRGANEYELSYVTYRDGIWMMAQFLGHKPELKEMPCLEVIGNVYDNPELLLLI